MDDPTDLRAGRPAMIARRDALRLAGLALAGTLPIPVFAETTAEGETAMNAVIETAAAHPARIVAAGEGRAIPFPLHPISQLVAGTDMPANVSLFDVDFAPTAPGAPPHVHAHEDEVYYILSGEVTFLLGDRVETAGPGATVILPRGVWHATWNESDAPARALTFVSQDTRFERFFDEVAARVAAEGARTPMEAAKIVGGVAAEMGVEIDMARLPERAKPLFGMG